MKTRTTIPFSDITEVDNGRYTLAHIANAMREHDRRESPGSESPQWQAFTDESRRTYKVDPFDDEANNKIVSAGFAAYWLAVAAGDYSKAALHGEVPDDWTAKPIVIDFEIFADSVGGDENVASDYAVYLEEELRRNYPSADVSISYVPNHAGDARRNVFADSLAEEESVHHFIDQCWPRFLEKKGQEKKLFESCARDYARAEVGYRRLIPAHVSIPDDAVVEPMDGGAWVTVQVFVPVPE